MSKVVTCPVKRFAGTVTLRDPLDFPLIARWDEAIGNIEFATAAMREKYQLPPRANPDELLPPAYVNERFAVIERVLYPLLADMVETWDLKNIAPSPKGGFPVASAGTGAASMHALVAWLITECQKIYHGNEDSDPNE